MQMFKLQDSRKTIKNLTLYLSCKAYQVYLYFCLLALVFKEAAMTVYVMKVLQCVFEIELLPWLLCGLRDDTQLLKTTNKKKYMIKITHMHVYTL